MNTNTFIADWVGDHDVCPPPVVIAEGTSQPDARRGPNEAATRAAIRL